MSFCLEMQDYLPMGKKHNLISNTKQDNFSYPIGILFLLFQATTKKKNTNKNILKGSYDAFLKIIILCIWCNIILFDML